MHYICIQDQDKNSESLLKEINVFDEQEIELPKIRTLRKTSSFPFPEQDLYDNTHIIYSEVCGLGKSKKIKLEIEKKQ